VFKLRPEEFWGLTLTELGDMIVAYSEEERRQDEADYYRTAWLASHLMNATGHYKQPITPDKLLGKKKPAAQTMTKEDRDKAMKDLLAKFNKG